MNLNLGSGQRRFGKGWVNVDLQTVHPPDVVGDMFRLPVKDGSVGVVVSHHTLEHLWQPSVKEFVAETYRVLEKGGSLLVFVPDIRELARRWLLGQITDFVYCVNLYGAYMGNPADMHRWGYWQRTLKTELLGGADWSVVMPFNWRTIEGADICRDWWILGVEAVK